MYHPPVQTIVRGGQLIKEMECGESAEDIVVRAYFNKKKYKDILMPLVDEQKVIFYVTLTTVFKLT